MTPIEQEIIVGLITDKEYLSTVLPHLNLEYFTDDGSRTLVDMVKDFRLKYQSQPTVASLLVDAQSKVNLTDDQYKTIGEFLKGVDVDAAKPDYRWLVDRTEQFCKDRALYLALTRAIEIVNQNPNEKNKLSVGEIPELLQKALAVNFDTSVGHDYIDNAMDRLAFYNDTEEHLPFDLTLMNRITGGGVVKKSMLVVTAPTGVGKTLAMCHFAASYLMQGRKVLYITMEMSEERIAQRIDANLLDVDISLLKDLPPETFQTKIDVLRNRMVGDLVIKEFPTGSASSSHFRHLLTELKTKKQFSPDVIFIDYLNICASSRFGGSSDANSYSYVKAIAEELRGICVEYDCALITATQFNRQGSGSSDPSITDTSDSFGVPMTADLQIALFTTEEADHAGKIIIKQLKNRYNSITEYNKFTLKIDRTKMRLSDDTETYQPDPREAMTSATTMGMTDAALTTPSGNFSGFIYDDESSEVNQ